MKHLILSAIIATLLTGEAVAQDIRRETVRFDRGTSGTTIESIITGYQSVQYLLAVNAARK
jgi:hypothetical protein